MNLVAIGDLRGTIDDAIRPLASDLDTTPYELRLVLNAGLPAVVLTTVDESLARAAVAAIARHGHAAISCDRRDVVPSSGMTLLRDFQLEKTGLLAHLGSGDQLSYADIAVMLRATHRTTSETTEEVKERKLRPVMAIATGGLVLSKTTARTVTSSRAHNEQVLYIFQRGAAPPWLLRERSAHYGGLGAELRPTSLENYATTIRRLRECAPHAVYDERLMRNRPLRGVADGIEATDVYAHLLAKHLAKRLKCQLTGKISMRRIILTPVSNYQKLANGSLQDWRDCENEN